MAIKPRRGPIAWKRLACHVLGGVPRFFVGFPGFRVCFAGIGGFKLLSFGVLVGFKVFGAQEVVYLGLLRRWLVS